MPDGNYPKPVFKYCSHQLCRFVILCLLSIGFIPKQTLAQSEKEEFSASFGNSIGASQWSPTHDINDIKGTEDGMLIQSSGTDPYTIGPAIQLPQEGPVWIELRLKCSRPGSFQIFYFGPNSGPVEGRSVRMNVPADRWVTVRAPAPELEGANRLRLDPPSGKGDTFLESIRIYPRTTYPDPSLKISGAKSLPVSESNVVNISSSQANIRLVLDRWNTWNLNRNHLSLAESPSHYWLGYVIDGEPVWVQWDETEMKSRISSTRLSSGWKQTKIWTDPHGADWTFTRSIQSSLDHPGWFDGEWNIRVNSDREVLFLPMEFGFLGTRSFGAGKQQAVFPGLEYLVDEPSSSEKDLIGPESERRIPDTLKITYPMQAIVAENAFAVFSWESDPNLSAWFDSPDRWFGVNGHVMGTSFPGTGLQSRKPGSMAPYQPKTLLAGQTLKSRFQWTTGAGESVVDALKTYHQRFPFRDPAPARLDVKEYLKVAAAGWLESEIREGALYRHANWMGRFNPGPAADVYFYLLWLAENLERFDSVTDQIEKLKTQAEEVAKVIPKGRESLNSVSHIRTPAGALFLGEIPSSLNLARNQAASLLSRIESNGTVIYSASDLENDYGKTHWTNHATGISGLYLKQALELALFSGDHELIQQALDKLDQGLKTYRNAIPRGAQTWEVPLHTPDILASAHWIDVCVDAYQYTNDFRYLEAARYWAWTGAPFVYQQINAEEVDPIGLYSTIPVFGATSWIAPVWIGLPVQWCGLVYAQSLYHLAEVDPQPEKWKKLADGITITGAEHTWPMSDANRVGLLPDFFNLRMQLRDGPAINPGTLQAPMMRFLQAPPFYSWKRMNQVKKAPVLIVAAGDIQSVNPDQESDESQSFEIIPFLNSVPSRVIVHGKVKSVSWSSTSQKGSVLHEVQSLPPSTPGWVLTIQGPGIVRLIMDN